MKNQNEEINKKLNNCVNLNFCLIRNESDDSCIICLKPIEKIQNKNYYEIINFPLVLGWATSIHKAQGQTIQTKLNVVLPDNYKDSLPYVAFSRITNHNDLYIIGDHIKFDQIKPPHDLKNIIEYGLECKICKTFTHNKYNICDSCFVVPFEPPISIEEFNKKEQSYKDKIIRIAKSKDDEKWKIFLKIYLEL